MSCIPGLHSHSIHQEYKRVKSTEKIQLNRASNICNQTQLYTSVALYPVMLLLWFEFMFVFPPPPHSLVMIIHSCCHFIHYSRLELPHHCHRPDLPPYARLHRPITKESRFRVRFLMMIVSAEDLLQRLDLCRASKLNRIDIMILQLRFPDFPFIPFIPVPPRGSE